VQNEQEKQPAMIRKLFIAAGVAMLALLAVGSLASARMASMQLATTEGRGVAHVEGVSEGNLVRALEDARLPQPGRMPKIALGK
jgi:hypothetical protein